MIKENYVRATGFEIFRYAFGGVGSNIAFMITMMFLMFFYTDIFGISPVVAGTLMLVTRIIDAVTDPMMGMLSDRTRSKFGKFRPYIIFGAPLLGLSIMLLFSAPNLNPAGKIVYMYIVYISYSLISTVVNIPYHSLTPIITQDPDQRTTVVTAKTIGGKVGALLVTVLAMPLIKMFGGGAEAWQKLGILYGIILTIAFWICANGAKRHDSSTVTSKKKHLPFKEQIKLITHNRPLLMLMIAFGTDLVAFAVATAANVYYFKYCIGRPDLIGKTALWSVPFILFLMALIPKLSKSIGKKKMYLIGCYLSIAANLLLAVTPFVNIPMVIVVVILVATVGTIPAVIGWAMLPDCVEYGEWKLGVRGEGTISSSLTFINKFGMAIGGMLTGIILATVGYVAGQEQTMSTLKSIAYMKTLLPVVGTACSIIAMIWYPIKDNDYFDNMVAEIATRK